MYIEAKFFPFSPEKPGAIASLDTRETAMLATAVFAQIGYYQLVKEKKIIGLTDHNFRVNF